MIERLVAPVLFIEASLSDDPERDAADRRANSCTGDGRRDLRGCEDEPEFLARQDDRRCEHRGMPGMMT